MIFQRKDSYAINYWRRSRRSNAWDCSNSDFFTSIWWQEINTWMEHNFFVFKFKWTLNAGSKVSQHSTEAGNFCSLVKKVSSILRRCHNSCPCVQENNSDTTGDCTITIVWLSCPHSLCYEPIKRIPTAARKAEEKFSSEFVYPENVCNIVVFFGSVRLEQHKG